MLQVLSSVCIHAGFKWFWGKKLHFQETFQFNVMVHQVKNQSYIFHSP